MAAAAKLAPDQQDQMVAGMVARLAERFGHRPANPPRPARHHSRLAFQEFFHAPIIPQSIPIRFITEPRPSGS